MVGVEGICNDQTNSTRLRWYGEEEFKTAIE